jgi:hypothetical protein
MRVYALRFDFGGLNQTNGQLGHHYFQPVSTEPRVGSDIMFSYHAPVESTHRRNIQLQKLGSFIPAWPVDSLSAFETGDANPNTEPPPFYAPGRGSFERGRLLRWKR